MLPEAAILTAVNADDFRFRFLYREIIFVKTKLRRVLDVKREEALQPISFLSPTVRHLVCEKDTQTCGVADSNCLTVDGFINWKQLKEILPPATEDSEEYFLRATQWLIPVSRRVKMELVTASAERQELLFTNLQWTSAPETLKRSMRLLEEGSEIGLILSLLMSTAVLERSLGDVFLTRSSPCPSMLKDLLVTEELHAIFGATPMQLLQLVIGRPASLNLRNIAWHGFVSPGEIPAHYPWLLLCVAASLGSLLPEQGIEDIPHRPLITFPVAHLLDDVFPDISAKDLPLMKLLHETSSFVPTTMQPLWTFTLDAFAESRYGECVVLIPPQLEHCMRRLYCTANECQERLLTAESTVLFTTFREILSPTMADGHQQNNLRAYAGDERITLLLDLLTYPEGPRLRDTVSHGEVDLESCPRAVAKHLLCVCYALCVYTLPTNCSLRQESILQQIDQAVSSYQSRFHPVGLLKKQIEATADSLSEWNTLPRPPEDKIATEALEKNAAVRSSVCETAILLPKMASVNYKHFPLGLVEQQESIRAEVERLLAVRIHTLYRGWNNLSNAVGVTRSHEGEVIRLLRRIMSECLVVSEQVQQTLHTRYTQWQSKELRSRQRNTYTRMLDVVPHISTGLHLVVLLVTVCLHSLDKPAVLSIDKQATLVKLLKQVLQKCENLVSCSAGDRNRWDEARCLVDQLLQVVHTYVSAETESDASKNEAIIDDKSSLAMTYL